MICLSEGGDPPTRSGKFSGWGNRTAQCNVERENMALRSGCGVMAAE